MKNGVKKERKIVIRTIAAAAACAAVIIAAGSFAGPVGGILGHHRAGQTNAEEGAKEALTAAADTFDRMFTLQVKAAEAGEEQMVPLEAGMPLVIGDKVYNSWVLDGNEADGTVDYCFGLPQMKCEGAQIESITYSINHGVFQIVQPEDGESIVVDGQRFEGNLNTGSIGGNYDEERDGEPSVPFETVLYKSFTLDYDRQSDALTWINICDERPDCREIMDLIWNEDADVEQECQGMQRLLDGTVITCTVHYADGTEQLADVKVDTCVMTRRETGEPEEDGMDLDEKIVVATFELQ